MGMQKRPLSNRIEGVKYAVPPLIRHSLTADALTASSNAFRCFGRTRPSLLRFQAGHSGRYLGALPRCLAPSGSSLAGSGTLTCSLQRVNVDILTKRTQFVKKKVCSAFDLTAAVIADTLRMHRKHGDSHAGFTGDRNGNGLLLLRLLRLRFHLLLKHGNKQWLGLWCRMYSNTIVPNI